MKTILVTGSEGLIGKKLRALLCASGYEVKGLDKVFPKDHPEYGDITSYQSLVDRLDNIFGVIHLAAVSRVVWGQRDPEDCLRTNVLATQHLLELCLNHPNKPWFLYASSRETYGEQPTLPVKESAQLKPLNVYARSKVLAEQSVNLYRESGLQTAILRFSNVYGSASDHVDRVIPAFCRAAAMGGTLRLEGKENTFDFSHVNDVVKGILKAVQLLSEGNNLPTMHLLSGVGTTLFELATMVCRLSDKTPELSYAAPRNFDVAKFYGDPSQAKAVLGWEATTPLEVGLKDLIDQFIVLEKTMEKKSEMEVV